MIHIEVVTINNKEYKRIYSDDYVIERNGVKYNEAIDPIDSNRQYNETDTLIINDTISEIEEKAIAYDILTGVKK